MTFLRLATLHRALKYCPALALVAMACATPVSAMSAEPLFVKAEGPVNIGTTYSFDSATMGTDRFFNVYLPADYRTAPNKRYPVLYVIDGGKKQDFLHIAGLANLGGLSGMYPDMIVVGIETVDRRHELTTPTARKDYLKIVPNPGGASKFRAMIANEIIPHINANFRASDRRIVIGESLAAFFIVDSFVTTPDLFTDYIAISPSLWWDDMELAKQAPTLLAQQKTGQARSLFLTVANEGGAHRKGNDMFAAAITAAKLNALRFSYVPRDKEEHSTIYHGAALDALRWTFKDMK